MKKFIAVLLAFVLVLGFAGCGKEKIEEVFEKEEWPTNGFGSLLPMPDSEYIHIVLNFDDSFSANIEKATIQDFTNYVNKCTENGYTIEPEIDSDDYSAFNNAGHKVDIHFYESLEKVSIQLEKSKIDSTFTWPILGLATLLPEPSTNVGTICVDSSSKFTAYIGETSMEDYNNYINLCIENGFSIDHNKSEKVFSADNVDGVSLRLEYEGFNTMYISMYAPDDYDETENSNTEISSEETISDNKNEENISKAEEKNEELINGMRPEFKEAMDSYEAFFDEYCEFMKKYKENPTDLSLIADYATYMAKYIDVMAKLEKLGEDDLNDAELTYYIEVTNKITQKLLEVAY